MLLVVTTGGAAAGGLLWLISPDAAEVAWFAVATVGVAASGWWVAQAARARRVGVDVLAFVSLVGALAVGEVLAGAVVAIMLATGRALEAAAAGSARRELTQLVSRAPRRARVRSGDDVHEVPVEEVRLGDVVLVGTGEVVAIDGDVLDDGAVVDESALTGEPLPVTRDAGDPVRSGTVNAGAPFDLRATATAADSTYAGIVRLVASAEASTAPFVRLADRFALRYLAVSFGIAAVAGLVSGSAVRAVAVLVVATPCPMVLAAPVAIVAGLSRAARRGVVVKGGSALEKLAAAKVLLLDKTGTVTMGHPVVADVVSGSMPADEVLRLAASVDQASVHVLARAVVRDARRRSLELDPPTDVEEIAGCGVRAQVNGRSVEVGSVRWLVPGSKPTWMRALERQTLVGGTLSVVVAVDGEPVGAVLLRDPIRPDAARTIRSLRRDGVERVVMVTGDRNDVARLVGEVVGVDEVFAEQSPEDKVEVVKLERLAGTTVMVGDGINDAPALAVADLGVAVATEGASASSESADVVLTSPRLDRLGEAIVIAKRSGMIARQSVIAGIVVSVALMGVASFGYLPPVWGAVSQEFVDLAVIANALRALRDPAARRRVAPADVEAARRFGGEHLALLDAIRRLEVSAGALGTVPAKEAAAMVIDAHLSLVEMIEPHERAEEQLLYPALAKLLGGSDPLAPLTRVHVEISHLIRQLGRVVDELAEDGLTGDNVVEAQRILYSLNAILELHVAQEDESYVAMDDGSMDVAQM